MTTILTTAPFCIEDWQAWAPDLASPDAWKNWAENPSPIKINAKIETATIPAAIKRRSNHLTKMFLEVANLILSKGYQIDFVIFCSRHGDVHCTTDLLTDLAKHEALSPTRFVQSVHNSAAGHLSILHHFTHNITAIAAGEDSFFSAILEANAWLAAHPNKQVLLVMCDDNIPELYQQQAGVAAQPPYAAAFVISASHETLANITLHVATNTAHEHTDTPLQPYALQFLAWWLQKPKDTLTQHTGRKSYQWCLHNA